MPFELLPATLDDLQEIAEVRDDAFAGTGPLAEKCLPRTATMKQFTVAGWQMEFKDPSWHCLKYVDIEKAKIVGMAIWFVPARRPDGSVYVGGGNPAEVAEVPWPSDCDAELNKEVFVNFAKNRQAIMGDRPHYYLELLATLPGYRGSGAGRALIEWGVNKADEEGLESYVEALPQVIPLYEKFGWKVISSYTNERVKHTETFMLRPGSSRD